MNRKSVKKEVLNDIRKRLYSGEIRAVGVPEPGVCFPGRGVFSQIRKGWIASFKDICDVLTLHFKISNTKVRRIFRRIREDGCMKYGSDFLYMSGQWNAEYVLSYRTYSHDAFHAEMSLGNFGRGVFLLTSNGCASFINYLLQDLIPSDEEVNVFSFELSKIPYPTDTFFVSNSFHFLDDVIFRILALKNKEGRDSAVRELVKVDNSLLFIEDEDGNLCVSFTYLKSFFGLRYKDCLDCLSREGESPIYYVKIDNEWRRKCRTGFVLKEWCKRCDFERSPNVLRVVSRKGFEDVLDAVNRGMIDSYIEKSNFDICRSIDGHQNSSASEVIGEFISFIKSIESNDLRKTIEGSDMFGGISEKSFCVESSLRKEVDDLKEQLNSLNAEMDLLSAFLMEEKQPVHKSSAKNFRSRSDRYSILLDFVPEPSEVKDDEARSVLNDLVKFLTFCEEGAVDQSAIWYDFYYAYSYIKGVNLLKQAKSRDLKVIEYLDESGLLLDAYEVMYHFFIKEVY